MKMIRKVLKGGALFSFVTDFFHVLMFLKARKFLKRKKKRRHFWLFKYLTKKPNKMLNSDLVIAAFLNY